mmetsp:Transcript_13508/g.43079  ORF Transcript_13508/g.43079 Transcript_13508/m.43079 type:complete len:198 (-) Transcript_13508:600-1193(-)
MLTIRLNRQPWEVFSPNMSHWTNPPQTSLECCRREQMTQSSYGTSTSRRLGHPSCSTKNRSTNSCCCAVNNSSTKTNENRHYRARFRTSTSGSTQTTLETTSRTSKPYLCLVGSRAEQTTIKAQAPSLPRSCSNAKTLSAAPSGARGTRLLNYVPLPLLRLRHITARARKKPHSHILARGFPKWGLPTATVTARVFI